MARSDISTESVPADTGLNLTDMSTTAMTAGADNGVMVAYDPGTKLLLRNDQAGAAVYTIKVPNPSAYGNKGVTVPDATVNVAASKDVLYPLSSIFKQSDGKVYIDCDVTAQIAAIKVSG